MEYNVKFEFTCLSKKGGLSLKNGECSINTKDKLSKTDSVLIRLIATDMAKKTNKNIIDVKILEIN